MKDQAHKTPEGLEKIREIKKGMNHPWAEDTNKITKYFYIGQSKNLYNRF